MTALEKYKIIETLVPELKPEDWKRLIYHFEESYGFSILRDIVKFMANNKKDILIKIWPLGEKELGDCVKESSRSYMGLTQEAVDTLLCALNSVD